MDGEAATASSSAHCEAGECAAALLEATALGSEDCSMGMGVSRTPERQPCSERKELVSISWRQ
jgi:hypothetical protein